VSGSGEFGPIYTGHVLPYDHASVRLDSARVQHVLDGQLVLAPSRPQATHPSVLAEDMMTRYVTCGMREKAFNAGLGTPEAHAFVEAAAVLGAYIRRLENVAVQYAAHLAACSTPSAGTLPPDHFTR
jgi:hypothetical protein